MCDVGGPRCELANLMHSERKKLKRTKKFKEADSYEQRNLLYKLDAKVKNTHPTLVQAHAPEKERWQTEGRKLSRRKLEALSKLFPKVEEVALEEGRLMHERMAEEARSFHSKLTLDEKNALDSYGGTSYDFINGILRKGTWKDEVGRSFWEPGEAKRRAEELIALIDSAFAKADENTVERTLYRHHLVPSGWTPKEYAERYFPLGGVMQDQAYMSTSEDTGYIAGHTFSRRPSEYVIYQILTSKGVSMVPEKEYSGHVQSLEKERLLPRGTKLRVVGHRRGKFSVAPERRALRERFAYNVWDKKIPPKFFTVVQLVEEEAVEDLLGRAK